MQEAPDPLIVEGVVEAGDQRGRELGFPTANLSLAGDAVRGDGVWAGLVRLVDEPDSRPWVAAVSVGRRPTFYDRRGPLVANRWRCTSLQKVICSPISCW